MGNQPLQNNQLHLMVDLWHKSNEAGFNAKPGTGKDFCYFDCESHEKANVLSDFFRAALIEFGEDVEFYPAHFEAPNSGTRLVVRLLGIPSSPRRPFGILALSGGGMRGLFQAAILERISDELPTNEALKNHFKILAGTSTGAIIAASLAFEIPPNETCSLFVEHGREIFAPRTMAPLRKGGRYANGPLKALLDKRFENKVLGDADPPLLLCATSLEQFGIRAFCSWRDKEIRVADAVLASCAAPTYFPAVPCTPDLRSYVDGGIWANDPSLCAILEAQNAKFSDFDNMWVLSIGNGEVALGVTRNKYNRKSTYSTKMVSAILDMMFCTQSSFAATCVTRLLGDSSLLQVNAQLPRYIALDDVSASIELLPALADKCASDHMRKIKSMLGLRSGYDSPGFSSHG